MKISKVLLFLLFQGFLFWAPLDLFGQESEITQIKAQREASNAALRNFDEDLNSTFLTDDVLITTGAGTLISGKKALQDYIKRASGPKIAPSIRTISRSSS